MLQSWLLLTRANIDKACCPERFDALARPVSRYRAIAPSFAQTFPKACVGRNGSEIREGMKEQNKGQATCRSR